MTEKYKPIPHRLKNMTVGGHVAGAEDIDAGDGKTQQDINADTYRKNETYSKEQLDNMITTPEQEYLSVTATAETTSVADIATLIATKYPDGKESADTVYRVGCWDGEQYNTNAYAEYVWDGTQYILAGVKNPGIDVKPILNSSKLIESGAVYELQSSISNKITKYPADILAKVYYPNTDTLSDSENYQVWDYDVTPGKGYMFSGKFANRVTLYFISWLDDSKNLISYESYKGSMEGEVTYTDQHVQAPQNAAYARLNVQKINKEKFNLKELTVVDSAELYNNDKEQQSTLSTLVEMNFVATTPSSYMKTDGTIASDDNYCIKKYQVTAGQDYVFSGFRPRYHQRIFVAWLDSNENFMFAEPYIGSSEKQVEYRNKRIVAPNYAAYAILNIHITYYSKHNFASIGDEISSNQLQYAETVTNGDISELIPLSPDSVTENEYLDSYGESVSYSAYRTHHYSVEGGASYRLKGVIKPANAGIYMLLWLDSSDRVIYTNYRTFTGDTEDLFVNDTVIAPAKAVRAIINIRKDYSNYFKFSAINKTIKSSDLQNKVLQNKAMLSNSIALEVDSVGEHWIDVDGTLIPANKFITRYYTVEAGKTYLLSGSLPSGNSGMYILHWFDENNNHLFCDYVANSTDGITVVKEPVTAPTNAVIAGIVVKKDRANMYDFSVIDEYIDCEKVQREVEKKADLSAISELVLMEPDEILENQWYNYNKSSEEAYIASQNYEIWKYAVEAEVEYAFSSSWPANITLVSVGWFDENNELVQRDMYKGSMGHPTTFVKEKVVAPHGAAYAYLNVKKSESSKSAFYSIGNIIDISGLKEEIENGVEKNIKAVVNSDNTFYVRGRIDADNDFIIYFNYYQPFGFEKNNSINPEYIYIGSHGSTDNEIMNSNKNRRFYDIMMPLSLRGLGPFGANHGLSTPRITVTDHGLTDADLGTVWIDENDWDYTIVKISGNYIYLMPVIHNKEQQGYEYRDWVSYNDLPKPEQITRNGVTLVSESTQRYDFQVSKLSDIKVTIDDVEVNEGTYYGNKVELQYHQTVYDPVDIDTWVPTPVYGRVDFAFDRHLTLVGTNGFASISYNTKLDVKELVGIAGMSAAGFMMPISVDGYDTYLYVPKLAKSGFTEEFISNTPEGAGTYFHRTASELADVDDIPDRIYSYLVKNNDVLFGMAGGLSLVRGATKPSVRNNNIPLGERCGHWSPAAGNKYYATLLRTDEMLNSSTFLEWEFYTAFYKPENDVQSWFYKSGDEYILYIHTKSTHTKEAVKVPDLLNGLNVKGVVEKTDNISYLNDIISNGKLYINSGSGYEYLVLRIG